MTDGHHKSELHEAGFWHRPGKGAHTVWGHSLLIEQVTLAGRDGDDAKPYQERLVPRALAALHEAERGRR